MSGAFYDENNKKYMTPPPIRFLILLSCGIMPAHFWPEGKRQQGSGQGQEHATHGDRLAKGEEEVRGGKQT